MKKIYIFGLGKGKKFVDRCVIKDSVKLLGYIDNYKAGAVGADGVRIIRQKDIDADYDYVIISLMKYEEKKQEFIQQGIETEKIICFFDFSDASNEKYWDILDAYKWRTELMWRHYTEIIKPSFENLDYEIYGEEEAVRSQCPKIIDADSTVEILLRKKKCLARFGDGEFELMSGRRRADFQDADTRLGRRLREALHSDIGNLLIAISDNYGKLGKYTDKAAGDIRSYMSKTVRKEHMELLELDREYYDAYISRPYIIYRDKEKAGKRFANIKKIWNGQDVLIVEGEYTRFGVGNDLLDNAASVSRILVPGKNAFSKYDEIINEVRGQGKEKLILVILGPTATVLAYDLSREGYWIIDIGQLDVEYEWYLRGVDERCDIPYKCVSEVNQYNEIVTDDGSWYIQKYKKEIVCQIL